MCLIAICLQSLFRSHLNSTAHTGILVHAKQHRTILRPHSGPLNTEVHPLLSGPPLQISLGAHAGPYPSALSRAQASERHRAQPQGGGKQHGQYSSSSAVHSHSCRDAPPSYPRTHRRLRTAYTARPARYLEMAMLILDFLFSGLNSPNFFCLFSEAVFLNLQSFSLLSSGLSPRFCILFKL